MLSMNKSTATDEIYRNRSLNFHFSDGTSVSSRDANWHQVNLSKVEMLELTIRSKTYRIRKSDLPESFVEFVHFRSRGNRFVISNNNLSVPEEYNSWSIGWTDGATEFMCEVDFQTGDIIENYDRPLSKERHTHFHPQSKILERGIR